MAVSCRGKLNGVLLVDTPIKLKGNMEMHELSPGDYEAEIQVRKNRLELRLNEDKSKNYRYNFHFPRGFKLPGEGEQKTLEAEDSGQPYDLTVTVDSETTTSDLISEAEGCSYERYEYVCRISCGYELITVYGNRMVEYRIHTKEIDYLGELSEPGSESSLAEFEGVETVTKREYQYVGICH